MLSAPTNLTLTNDYADLHSEQSRCHISIWGVDPFCRRITNLFWIDSQDHFRAALKTYAVTHCGLIRIRRARVIDVINWAIFGLTCENLQVLPPPELGSPRVEVCRGGAQSFLALASEKTSGMRTVPQIRQQTAPNQAVGATRTPSVRSYSVLNVTDFPFLGDVLPV